MPDTAADPQTVLDRLDGLAGDLIARVAPRRFGLVQAAAEREAIYRLRYQVVVERGWAAPDDLLDGRELDDYDEGAEYVAGWDGPTLVAAARLVFPIAGRRLPTEAAFDLRIEPFGAVVNVDRLIVARSSSDGGHRMLRALVARCWLEIRRRGFHVWAGIDSSSMLRLYRRLGFAVTVLGPPRPYWGQDRYPVCFDPLSATVLPWP
jgi:N-acyl-L-homoserine lactone synthetase